MLTINRKQVTEIDNSIIARKRKEFLIYLQSKFLERGKEITQDELYRQFEHGYVNANKLDIYEDKEIYRFIALNFISPEIANNSFYQKAIYLILINLKLSGKERLDFIETQILHQSIL